MSATYINTGGGFIQYSGIITTSEINNLGTTPYNFTTPENFAPLGFLLTVISGTTQPIFTALLSFITVSNNRTLFLGINPAIVDFTNFYGFPLLPIPNPTYATALNIELYKPNNFVLTPSDNADPTPGDYTYKYNLFGTIIF
jgi:hypothetical protein